MQSICFSLIYTDWRGETGNYILLVLLALAALINLFGVCIVVVNSVQPKLSKYLLITFLCGNVLAAASQTFNTVIQLYYTMKCPYKVTLFLTHRIGMMTSSSVLLLIIISHYNYAVKRYILSPRENHRLLRKAVIIQVILDFFGICFICFPNFFEGKIVFCFSTIAVIAPKSAI